MIASYIKALGPKLPSDRFEQKGDMIWIARSASIAEYTTIIGPAIIGESVEVRPAPISGETSLSVRALSSETPQN